MNRKMTAAVVLLAALAVCLSAVSLYLTLKPASGPEQDVQYVLYLGTNGKDTNAPVFPPEEAKARAQEVLVRHFGGFTLQEADGGWVGDDGTLYEEHTIVISLSDTTRDKVHAACDELLRVFDQSSVLIQENRTRTEFYAGT